MAGNAFASVCGLVMIARVFGTTEPRDFPVRVQVAETSKGNIYAKDGPCCSRGYI